MQAFIIIALVFLQIISKIWLKSFFIRINKLLNKQLLFQIF